MSDEDSPLERVSNGVLELHEVADAQLAKTWDTVVDDRWGHLFPLVYEQQVRLLFLQALDAVDLAVHGLRWRPSPGALGLVRSLAETACVLRWLSEASDESQKKARASGLLRASLNRTRKLHREAGRVEGGLSPEDLEGPGEAIADALQRLDEIAALDGVAIEGPPERRELFDLYFPEGYHTFGALSEVGSHPGFMSLRALYLQPDGRVDFNPTASPQLRAFWIGIAGKAFVLATAATAVSLGWDQSGMEEVIQSMERVSVAADETRSALISAQEWRER